MILSAMFAASILLADATPKAAVTPAPAAAANPAPAPKAEKPRLICRTEAVTGSLMAKKTCYASDDMAQRKQEERQNLEKLQDQLPIRSN
jgi:3-oxoacyl-ACP reductase-like protein